MKQMAEYMQGQALQARSVAADIGSLSFPVYGLIDDFMGLKFSSSGYGGGARGFDNAHFTYLGPDEGGVKSGIGLLVETHVRHFRATHGDDVDEPWQARLAAEQVWRRFEPSDERERRFRDRESPNTWLEQLGEEQSSTIEMSLNGFPSEASVLRWSGEHEVLAFVTKNDESIVRIATVGLAKEDLRNLTAHIHVINHRPDVLAKYQLIMDARFDELRRRFPGDAK
jgi:hypothetical protein